MTSTELFLLAGWTACLSAAVTMITLVTGVLFFTRGQPFGTMNDAASVFQMLCMVPIAIALHHLLGPYAPTMSLLAAVTGIMGMLVAVVPQALLVVGRVKYEQTVRVVSTAGGAIGAWLLLLGYLALSSAILPGGLAWLGLLAKAGYVLSVVGFWLAESGIRVSGLVLSQQRSATRLGRSASDVGYYQGHSLWQGRARRSKLRSSEGKPPPSLRCSP